MNTELVIAIATAAAAFFALIAIIVQVRMAAKQQAAQERLAANQQTAQERMVAQQDAAQYIRHYNEMEFKGSDNANEVERDIRLSFLLLTVRQVRHAYPDDSGWIAILLEYLSWYCADLIRWRNDPEVGETYFAAYGPETVELIRRTIASCNQTCAARRTAEPLNLG